MGRRGTGQGVRLALVALALCGCYRGARPEWAWHPVVAGDTLTAIAARYRVSVAAVADANALTDADAIHTGDLLYIPIAMSPARPRPAHRQARALGPARVPARPRDLASSDGKRDPSPDPSLLAWPVAAPISSRFGLRDGRPHEGIDLSVSDGTEVHAAARGQVVYSGAGLRGYGKLVMLRHAGGLTTIYAHNSTLRVAEGATVERGCVISLSGHSGRASAPHLHFEVRDGDVPRDPELYLPPHSSSDH